MSFDDGARAVGLVKPGRALTGVMVLLGSLWLMFAIAVNWAGAGPELFLLFCGNTAKILHGEVWRLFTASLMHAPGTVGHILTVMFGLFFLAPSLEQRWGSARMLRFLVFSSIIAYALQMAVEVLLPASLAARLVGDHWFGAIPALEAIAVAWALSFRGQVVRLMFVLPVTSQTLLVFIVVINVLRVFAVEAGAEGLVSPFGGMFAGWLLGGGTPSPLRRAYLRLRLAQLDREGARGDRRGGKKHGGTPLRVIEGGRNRTDSESGSGGRMLH